MKQETFDVDKEMAYLKEDKRDKHYLENRVWKKSWQRTLNQVRIQKTKTLK